MSWFSPKPPRLVEKDLDALDPDDTFDQWVHTLEQNAVYLGAPVTYLELLRIVRRQLSNSGYGSIEASILREIRLEASRNRVLGRRWG